LYLISADVFVLADLGDALHQLGNLFTELLGQGLARGESVLEHVVQQADGDTGAVEPELGQNVGDL
jgi:hypothetical protein